MKNDSALSTAVSANGSTALCVIETSAVLNALNEILEATVDKRTAQLQQANAALMVSEHQRRETQRIARLGYGALNLTSGVFDWSEEVYTIFGRDPATFQACLERFYREILYPEDAAIMQRALSTFCGSGQRKPVDFRFIHADGSVRWAHLAFGAHLGATDSVEEVQGYIQDVTERKEMEEAQRRLAANTASRQAEEELRRSSQMLQVVLDNVPGGVFWKDSNLVYLGCNIAAARAAGLSAPGEIIGKSDYDVAWKAGAEGYRADDRAVMESGIPKNDFEEALPKPDGSIGTIVTNKFPLYDNEGNVCGVIGTFEDITERKRAEVKLRESEEMLQSIMATARDGIILLDNEGRISFWNQAAETMLGYTAAEAAGQKLHRFVVPVRYRDAGDRGFAHFRMTGEGTVFGQTLEPVALKKDGTEIDVEVSVSAVKIKDQWAALGIMRDISERKRTQIELESIHVQLVDASRRGGMSEIATNILHNVGNVLNSVNISAELIAQSVKNSGASNLTRVVALLEEHAQDLGAFMTTDSRGKHLPAHLARLSEHLLAEQAAAGSELDSLRRNVEHIKEIVAMQQNYATFGGVKETIDVVSLVEDSLRINEDALSRYRVEVIREFDKVPALNADKHKVLQILVNLLRNAKQACQNSERTDPRLTVRVTHGDGRLKISVMDNGIGILPENLTRIFSHGFTTRKDGHGFGLHSGALAVKEMGGLLTVCSDGPGQGATFTMELPSPDVGELK